MAERYCAERLVYQVGQRTLINDVSLALSPGEMVALIGPNGAGNRRYCACSRAISRLQAGNAAWQVRRLRRGTRKSSHAAGQ